MGEVQGVYAIWLREFTVYLRERERAIASVITPLLWIFAFGSGLGASVAISGTNYQTFIFPGIMAMNVLFTSVFYGMYIIWDRKLDFLKEVLVAPLSRKSVFIGKMLGGVTDSMIQVSVLFIIGYFIGVPLTPASVIASFIILFLVAVCMTSIGLFFGAMLSSMESFQLIMTFFIWPVFFFSGALFPLDNLPAWLAPITRIDPLTYGVDALRTVMLGLPGMPLYISVGVLAVSSLLAMGLGMLAFERMGKI